MISHEFNSHDLCCFHRFLLKYFRPHINKFLGKFLPFLEFLVDELDLFLNQNNLLFINLNNIPTKKILLLLLKLLNLTDQAKNIQVHLIIRLLGHKFPILIIKRLILILKFLVLLPKVSVGRAHFLNLGHVEVKFVLV